VKHRGRYYAYYHGSGPSTPRTWTTNVAVSDDLVHWTKYANNPLVPGDRSSGVVVPDGESFRLYTMHNQVELHLPRRP
jgi:sucrose-6-phosphate hydrolase SacC (GH32 family)